MTNNTDKMREAFSTSIPTTAQGWAFALAEASNAAAKARAVADHETYLPIIRAIINQTLTHEREHAEMLAEALRCLLQDTQHSEHKCRDDDCPVKVAREALVIYEGKNAS